MADYAVKAQGLVKRFGSTEALAGLNLRVQAGTVFGLLGPNGAGKTTCIRVLSTLLRPDAGRATVAGHDVLADPAAVRRAVGLAGQYASLDDLLTGRQNLVLLARLLGLPRRLARERADALLERFDLTGAAQRTVATYSGGMRRRLDLAASIIGEPQVVVLDEPTSGLDPLSRAAVWDLVRELVADGATLLLTTQYLEEADRLADRIAVVDAGRVVAEGTPGELKALVGGKRLEITLLSAGDAAAAVRAVGDLADGEATHIGDRVQVPLREGYRSLVDVVRRLDAAGVEVGDVSVSEPSLDDVFLRLTGHRTSPAEGEAA